MSFSVGEIVDVKSRCWPGINKPGGRGFVKNISEDGYFSVSYVLGGTEKDISPEFVSKIVEEAPRSRGKVIAFVPPTEPPRKRAVEGKLEKSAKIKVEIPFHAKVEKATKLKKLAKAETKDRLTISTVKKIELLNNATKPPLPSPSTKSAASMKSVASTRSTRSTRSTSSSRVRAASIRKRQQDCFDAFTGIISTIFQSNGDGDSLEANFLRIEMNKRMPCDEALFEEILSNLEDVNKVMCMAEGQERMVYIV